MTRRFKGLAGWPRWLIAGLAIGASVLALQHLLAPALRERQARSWANQAFDARRLFVLLEREHPELRPKFVDAVGKLARDSKSLTVEDIAKAWGEEEMADLVPSYVGRAPDDALVSYLSATVEVLDHLGSNSGDACFRFVFPKPGERMPTDALPPALKGRMVGAGEALVAGALATPVAPAQDLDLDELLEQLSARLVAKHGEAFLDGLMLLEHPHAPNTDRSQACFVVREFYREMLSFPPPHRAAMFRKLLAPP